jgi:succinate dehydrogenase / fumarate reductase membrane anchor subunit
VESTSVEVTPNFSNPFWQIYAFILVAFAATHGFNGLRVILEDYVKSPLALAWLRGMLVFIWLFVLLAAIFLIFVYV